MFWAYLGAWLGQSAPVACGVFCVLHPPPLRNHSLDGAHSSFTRRKLIRLVRQLKNGILSEARNWKRRLAFFLLPCNVFGWVDGFFRFFYARFYCVLVKVKLIISSFDVRVFVCEWNTTHAAEHSGYYKSLSSPSCDIHARVLSCSTCILLCKCTHIMDVCQNSVYGWKRSQNPPFSILFFSPQLYEEFRFPSIHQFGSLLAFQAYGAEVITIKQYFGGPLIFFRIKSLVARSEMCKLKFHFWSTGDDNLYKFWAQWDSYISKNAI